MTAKTDEKVQRKIDTADQLLDEFEALKEHGQPQLAGGNIEIAEEDFDMGEGESVQPALPVRPPGTDQSMRLVFVNENDRSNFYRCLKDIKDSLISLYDRQKGEFDDFKETSDHSVEDLDALIEDIQTNIRSMTAVLEIEKARTK